MREINDVIPRGSANNTAVTRPSQQEMPWERCIRGLVTAYNYQTRHSNPPRAYNAQHGAELTLRHYLYTNILLPTNSRPYTNDDAQTRERNVLLGVAVIVG
jgi:hypothetical protein